MIEDEAASAIQADNENSDLNSLTTESNNNVDLIRTVKNLGGSSIASSGSNTNGNEETISTDPIVAENQSRLKALMEGGGSGSILNTSGVKQPTKNRYEGTNYAVAKAVVSHANPNLTMPKGTFIKCSLRTKIITNVGGEAGCVITDDVYSENGNVVLIEKGSQIFGHFKTGELRPGDTIIFIVWNEVKTPNNIRINIDSNATGSLGETGVGGWVNNHFWKRFGNAIMVSMLNDAGSALSTRLQKDRTNVDNTQNTREAAQQVTESIISKSIDIPPTLYKNQGDIVGVFLSRDLDFSDVYELGLK